MQEDVTTRCKGGADKSCPPHRKIEWYPWLNIKTNLYFYVFCSDVFTYLFAAWKYCVKKMTFSIFSTSLVWNFTQRSKSFWFYPSPPAFRTCWKPPPWTLWCRWPAGVGRRCVAGCPSCWPGTTRPSETTPTCVLCVWLTSRKPPCTSLPP